MAGSLFTERAITMKKRLLFLLTTLILLFSAMPVLADNYNWGAFYITLTTQDQVLPGKSVTFAVTVKNTTDTAATPHMYPHYFQDWQSDDIPGVPFGRITGGSGYSIADDEIALTLPANGSVSFSLTGTIPYTWNSNSEILVVITDEANGRMGQGGYPVHDPADPDEWAQRPTEPTTETPTQTETSTTTSQPTATTTPAPTQDTTSVVSAPLSGSYSTGQVEVNVQNGKATIEKITNKKSKSVTIPSSVTVEGQTVPVTGIGDGAFSNLTNVKKITVGKNVEKIGKKAFKTKSKKGKTIVIQSKKLQAKNVNAHAFDGLTGKDTLKVPKSVKKNYLKWLYKKGLKKAVKVK